MVRTLADTLEKKRGQARHLPGEALANTLTEIEADNVLRDSG